MADILIKNVPANIHKKLKEMALYHHRSMTKEALAMLEEAAASYSVPEKQTTTKEKFTKKEMAERRRRMKEAFKRMTGSGTVKMTTDELMKPTRDPILSTTGPKREVPVPYKGIKPVTQKQLNRWKRDGMA